MEKSWNSTGTRVRTLTGQQVQKLDSRNSEPESLIVVSLTWKSINGAVCLQHVFLFSTKSGLVLLLLDGLGSAQSAGTAGSDETDLATGGRVPPDGRGFANMLVVTATEGMLDGLRRGRRTPVREPPRVTAAASSSSKRTTIHSY